MCYCYEFVLFQTQDQLHMHGGLEFMVSNYIPDSEGHMDKCVWLL